jgi:enoyl-CoA hydratase
MAGFAEVRYETRQSSAVIVLDRPEHLNALTPVMARELLEAIKLAEADASVRSIVITGGGTAFCAGAELTYFRERLAAPDDCERFIAELLHPLGNLVRAIVGSPLPVIAAVNGVCAAGGFELALRCDFVVASSTATFMDAHSRRGLGPAIGGAAALIQAVGHARALTILARSERVPALDMLDYGFVTEVCDPSELDRRVDALAATLAQRSPRSIATMKRAAAYEQSPTLEQTLERDLDEFRAEWGSADMVEGVSAFVDGRRAVFTR